MRTSVYALLISTLAVSGCATKANPFNWFGGSRSAAPVAASSENTNPLIPDRSGLFRSNNEEVVFIGQPLDTVSSLVVERVPDGIIIRATGVAARQGFYAVQLTPDNDDEQAVDGVLTYRLQGLQGPSAGSGPPASREVVAARKVTNQKLQGTRTIRVEAKNNAVQARR
ncbi:MAG: hypothetical protein R8G34_00280 [Paracoccaceae bacterium]|nr:hypothetical protein [Paracoccaceae bacterium]